MIKIIERVWFIFVFLIVLPSCTTDSDRIPSAMEKSLLATLSVNDMNESLQLKVQGDEKTFGFGSDIPLLIYNKSPHSILFTGDSHMRLFTARDGEWLEVKNEITYSGAMILSPQGTPLLDLSNTGIKPAFDEELIDNNKNNMLLRIVMIGEILENDVETGELVGAYVDVSVSP
jgi:hypothetical protein